MDGTTGGAVARVLLFLRHNLFAQVVQKWYIEFKASDQNKQNFTKYGKNLSKY